ncbi:uncharacterized protein CTHT_0047210 [Thermochaetoides thermophila DSM 1495]|uniref:CCHC-type domain-containing protein n=1 Tax=Chaetomium thermophilum (strain DSM 1495 / CBS 144.50 / IMI 039719) TaxID=759272 RepID=G0S9U5_CHATD|nr:hypothetical protein CTHT_0047210 [Thermochaetoides thermophila DSM 1495]EGS20206.1 hypothetical protein CTHT_0047210 [Thermochaetoides thermophila DSM 1495]
MPMLAPPLIVFATTASNRGLGHVQAECPTLRLGGAAAANRCYNCDQPGHLARNCPNPPINRGPVAGRPGFAPGRFANGGRPATCYKCGGPNHFARDCQAQAMKCYACGKLGHISRDCTAPNGGPLNTPNGEGQNEQADVNGNAQPAPQQTPVAPVA